MAEMAIRDLAIRLKRAARQCNDNPNWVSGRKWGPTMQRSLADLLAAAKRNSTAIRKRAKEVREKDVALAPLAAEYSRYRLMCLAVDPGLSLADFRAGTTGRDDFFINLDALMDHLEAELEQDLANDVQVEARRFEFAEEALGKLRPLRAAFDKEAAESDAAKNEADDASPALAAAEAGAMVAFTTYRKLARANFGDRSKEAAELRNPPKRRGPADTSPTGDAEIDDALTAVGSPS